MRPRFFVAEALRSIRANMAIAVAAIATVLITVFILGAFIPSFLYVRSTVDEQKQKLDINVYVSDSATVDQVNGLQGQLTALRDRGLVREVTFVSKEDALVELRERLRDPSILDELPSNPLPAKFNLVPMDPERNDEIAAEVAEHPAVDPELGVKTGGETADRVIQAARIIQWAGLSLLVVLLVASVLLIANTIRLSIFARRREVEVMKLVGATNWFIRWPFVIEGIITGVIGAVLSLALLYAVKIGIVDQFISDNGGFERDEARTIGFVYLSLILVAAGAVVGAVGSGVTLRRFLRV